jgi:hypothetical protein
MSLGWSLRGQFGHLKGALIPGALAAVAWVLLHRNERERKNFGSLLLFGCLGFALGGHLGYGDLIRQFLERPSLGSGGRELVRIFLTGATWGGLGMSYLGLAASESPLRRRDALFWSGSGLLVLLFADAFSFEAAEIVILGILLAALHLYNLFVQRSKSVTYFGIYGFLGFGGALAGAVTLLDLGSKGFLGSTWPWWNLRDQLWGFFGGLVLWFAAGRVRNESGSSAGGSTALQKAGLVFYWVFIPAVNTRNVLGHWILAHPPWLDLILWGVAPILLIAFAFLFVSLLRLDAEKFSGPSFDRLLSKGTLIFIWYLSLIAIAKEISLYGTGRWEPGFTIFIGYSLLLTLVFHSRSRGNTDPLYFQGVR